MKFNSKYIEEVFNENKDNLIKSEQEIRKPKQLESYLLATIQNGMQLDFGISLDFEKLFEDKTLYVISGCDGNEDGVSNYVIGVYANYDQAKKEFEEAIKEEEASICAKGVLLNENCWNYKDLDNMIFENITISEVTYNG